MLASPLLIDSCFYLSSLRQGRDPFRELSVAAHTRDLVICGVIRCEVGRGLKTPKLREKFAAVWDVMINVPTDNRIWQDAEKLAWDLDRSGITLPLTDIVIGCCAKRIGAVVLTFDRHFHEIPELTVTDRLV
jgi:predicted nucleic acid-binding protein